MPDKLTTAHGPLSNPQYHHIREVKIQAYHNLIALDHNAIQLHIRHHDLCAPLVGDSTLLLAKS